MAQSKRKNESQPLPPQKPKLWRALLPIGVLLLLKQLPLSEDQMTIIGRIIFAIRLAIQTGVFLMIYRSIRGNTEGDKEIVPAHEKDAGLGQMEPVEAMTVNQYDTGKLMDLVQNQLIQILIVVFIHYRMGFVQPLILSSVMALTALTDSEVFRLHILKQDPHEHRALRRPFGGVNPQKSGFSALLNQFMEATEEDDAPKKGKGTKPSKKHPFKGFPSTSMSNITTPEAATPPVETDVADVDMSQTPSSADEVTAPVKLEKAAEPAPPDAGNAEDTISLDPSVNREPAGHFFRGELFLSEAELGSVCEALQESGFAFEEVKTPPASPRAELSFAAAVSARRRTRESTAAARSSSTVDGVSDSSPALRRRSTAGKRKRGLFADSLTTLEVLSHGTEILGAVCLRTGNASEGPPTGENAASMPDSPSSSMKMSTVDEQKTGQSFTPRRVSTTKKSSVPVNVSAAPTTASGSPILMSGKDPGARIMMPRGAVSKMGEDGARFRSVFLGVLNTIEADQGFSGADSIPYWFSHPVLPRQIEGVSFSACQLPINLGHVRHMVEEGKYNTHLELERDLRRLVRFALRNYPKTSQPFKAAERLNKLCTELMFDASYRIGNAEYVEAQYPAIEEPPEATPTSSTHRHQASGGGKAGSHKGSKQPVAHKSQDKESVKESRKKSKTSSGGSKAAESELTAQIEQLQDRISELTQF
ncbi:hypothetical protein FOZ63_033715, partial [Perkinsus olseni]